MKRLASEGLVYGLSGVLSKMINILLLPLYANYFTVSEYGVLAVLTVFTSLLSQLVILQLDSGAFRFILDKENTSNVQITLSSWFWTQTSLSIFVLVLCYLFRFPLSSKMLGSSDYSQLIFLSVLVLPFTTIEIVCITYWRIFGKKWHVAITNILGVIMLLTLNYYFVRVLKLGIISLAWSSLIVGILKTIFLTPQNLSIINPLRFDMNRLKGMLQYCLPFVPAGISLWVVTLIDRIILEHYTSTNEVGIYQMAYNVSSLLMLPISAFLQAWSPYVFSILNNDQHKRIIANGILIFIILTSIFALITTLFSSEILYLFTSPSYFNANNFIPLLLFSNISMGLYQLSGIGSAIAKKSSFVMWATIIAAIINVGLNFAWIPTFTISGASWATFISYTIIPTYLFYLSQKVYHIPYNFKWMIISFVFFFIVSMIIYKSVENFSFNFEIFISKILGLVIFTAILFILYKRNPSRFKSLLS